MQKYSQQDRNTFAKLLTTVILSSEIIGFAVFGAVVRISFKLPTTLRQSYSIYDAVESADARILLPFKGPSSWVTANASVDVLPTCSATLQDNALPPGNLPRWTLPTNNTDLQHFVSNQVWQVTWA
jgi:hypothetical protein